MLIRCNTQSADILAFQSNHVYSGWCLFSNNLPRGCVGYHQLVPPRYEALQFQRKSRTIVDPRGHPGDRPNAGSCCTTQTESGVQSC